MYLVKNLDQMLNSFFLWMENT